MTIRALPHATTVIAHHPDTLTGALRSAIRVKRTHDRKLLRVSACYAAARHHHSHANTCWSGDCRPQQRCPKRLVVFSMLLFGLALSAGRTAVAPKQESCRQGKSTLGSKAGDQSAILVSDLDVRVAPVETIKESNGKDRSSRNEIVDSLVLRTRGTFNNTQDRLASTPLQLKCSVRFPRVTRSHSNHFPRKADEYHRLQPAEPGLRTYIHKYTLRHATARQQSTQMRTVYMQGECQR